eukprot:TRINITY_DN26986_c0_g1_i1.p1 TRINITY_DN26986_c0_g1~~TRINITY_DN26986_c0_g1_i1.p1  ORF type:complete len:320 (+),score=50.95 TRINITY_DN26986_c0_g1_i1:49-960(+)
MMSASQQMTATYNASGTAKLCGKTKLCKFHAMGCCKKASKCPFAHGLKELKEPPDLSKTSICKRWLKHECSLSADDCPFAHGKGDLRRIGPFSQATKAVSALSKERSREARESSSHSDDCCSSSPTGSDLKKGTLCSTNSNPDSDTSHIQSECSFASYSANSLDPGDFKDLSWDPIGMQQHPGPFVTCSEDPFAENFNLPPFVLSDEIGHTHKTNSPAGVLNLCTSSMPGGIINLSDANHPGACYAHASSLNAWAIRGIDHRQQAIVPAMTWMLVPSSWAPMPTDANKWEQILRSAQPECYED